MTAPDSTPTVRETSCGPHCGADFEGLTYHCRVDGCCHAPTVREAGQSCHDCDVGPEDPMSTESEQVCDCGAKRGEPCQGPAGDVILDLHPNRLDRLFAAAGWANVLTRPVRPDAGATQKGDDRG